LVANFSEGIVRKYPGASVARVASPVSSTSASYYKSDCAVL
jgi:hypothetical protein